MTDDNIATKKDILANTTENSICVSPKKDYHRPELTMLNLTDTQGKSNVTSFEIGGSWAPS